MKILVTGATGFIGARLCRSLINQGHNVRVLHRLSSPLQLLQGLEVERIIGDITQPQTLLNAVKGVDGIYHMAAMRGSGLKQPERMHSITVIGTRNILRAAFEAGVHKVVYTSSVAALGVPQSNTKLRDVAVVINEAHTWNFDENKWYYGYAKYLAEQEVQRAVAQGLDVVIVNPTVVMGGGDINNQTTSPVVLVAQKRLPVQIQGGINIIHVDDVVNGHIAAMERGKKGERYILGGDNLSLTMLFQKIAKIARVSAPSLPLSSDLSRWLANPLIKLQTLLPLPCDTEQLYLAGYNFYYDIRKAQSYLGFMPSHSTEDAILEAYLWFQNIGIIPSEKT